MNKYAIPQADPENIYSFTDKFGDTLNVVPDGEGGILFEIEHAGDTVSVNMTADVVPAQIMAMFRYAVDSTGMRPHELKEKAIKGGLLRPTSKPNRQERRRVKAKPAFNPGASFGVKA